MSNSNKLGARVIISLIFGSIVALALVGGIVFYVVESFTENDVTVTVSEKETKRSGDTDKYLIWSEEGEVFENTDNLLRGKFDSSDLQGELTEGEKYECTVIGYRVPILSTYRNLTDCTSVK